MRRVQGNENGHQSIEAIIATNGAVRGAFVSKGQFDCSCRIQWRSAANLHLALWLLGYLANTCPRWIGLSADGCTQARSKRFWARLWVRPLVRCMFSGGRDSARARRGLRAVCRRAWCVDDQLQTASKGRKVDGRRGFVAGQYPCRKVPPWLSEWPKF